MHVTKNKIVLEEYKCLRKVIYVGLICGQTNKQKIYLGYSYKITKNN